MVFFQEFWILSFCQKSEFSCKRSHFENKKGFTAFGKFWKIDRFWEILENIIQSSNITKLEKQTMQTKSFKFPRQNSNSIGLFTQHNTKHIPYHHQQKVCKPTNNNWRNCRRFIPNPFWGLRAIIQKNNFNNHTNKVLPKPYLVNLHWSYKLRKIREEQHKSQDADMRVRNLHYSACLNQP